MPPLTTRDYFIGCALQGLLANPSQDEIPGDCILSESEWEEQVYGDKVSCALEIADAVMQLRRERAQEN